MFGNQRHSLHHRQNYANKGATRSVDAPEEGDLDRIDAEDGVPQTDSDSPLDKDKAKQSSKGFIA